MNIVVGVDGKGGDQPSIAASLLRRLRFPNAAIDVVDVIEPIVYSDWGIDVVLSAEVFTSVEDAIREDAEQAVRRTAAQLRADNPIVPEEFDCGIVRTHCPHSYSATEGILNVADTNKADLIAVDGSHKGPLGALLTGSVARSLVIGAQHHSLLLAKEPRYGARSTHKNPVPKDNNECQPDLFAEPVALGRLTDAPLRVVFATDHSRYAQECLNKLIEMAPAGISHLTVLTAYPEDELTAMGKLLPDLSIHPEVAVRQSLAERNEAALDLLAPILIDGGGTRESRVIGAPVNSAIEQTMEETHSDLLILGARGHGFFDRLTLGSVSFHQAMTAPYSLLILRP